MRLLLSLADRGWHPAARHGSGAQASAATALVEAARRAEAAGFDAALFGLPGETGGVRTDPLPLVGAALAATREIGLGAFWPCETAEPFHVARVMATLDHLSGGRSAWIIGGTAQTARAAELVVVAEKLWDSWEDCALLADQASGRFADPERVHPIHHEGRFFTVRGPLNVPRPPQGHPVLICLDIGAGPERDALAPSADLVAASCRTPAEAASLKQTLRKAASGRAPLLVATIMPVLAASDVLARRRCADLDALAAGLTPSFVGTPHDFAEDLARWHEAGACDGFDLRPAAAEDLAMVLETTVPLLRQRFPRCGVAGATLRERLGLTRPAGQAAA